MSTLSIDKKWLATKENTQNKIKEMLSKATENILTPYIGPKLINKFIDNIMKNKEFIEYIDYYED